MAKPSGLGKAFKAQASKKKAHKPLIQEYTRRFDTFTDLTEQKKPQITSVNLCFTWRPMPGP
jgi:hypothetical protein